MPEAVVGEQLEPQRVVDAAVPERDAEHEQRVDRHDHGGEALDQPIHEAVMRPDRLPARYHRRTPTISVRARLTTSTTALDRRAGSRSMPRCRSSSR